MIKVGTPIHSAVGAERLMASKALLAIAAGGVQVAPSDRITLFYYIHGGTDFLDPYKPY